MKANIEFQTISDRQYIKTIQTDDIDGLYELDDETFEFDYATCYYLDNGELVLDTSKKEDAQETMAANAEIGELQQNLNETDYIMARCFEAVVYSLTNGSTFNDMLTALLSFKGEHVSYDTVITDREDWRDRIQELEGEIS